MSKTKDNLLDNLYSLSDMVVRVIKANKSRHYRSQPMPKHYSNPKWEAWGNAQPSIMQMAFIDAVVRKQNRKDGHHVSA